MYWDEESVSTTDRTKFNLEEPNNDEHENSTFESNANNDNTNDSHKSVIVEKADNSKGALNAFVGYCRYDGDECGMVGTKHTKFYCEGYFICDIYDELN